MVHTHKHTHTHTHTHKHKHTHLRLQSIGFCIHIDIIDIYLNLLIFNCASMNAYMHIQICIIYVYYIKHTYLDIYM